MVEEKFLIYSSSFVTPYRFYYAFDLVPSYWEELSGYVETGRIILLDMVKSEIEQGEDQLTDWLHENNVRTEPLFYMMRELGIKI